MGLGSSSWLPGSRVWSLSSTHTVVLSSGSRSLRERGVLWSVGMLVWSVGRGRVVLYARVSLGCLLMDLRIFVKTVLGWNLKLIS